IAFPMIMSTLIGGIIGICSGVWFGMIVGLDRLFIYSIAPKSVTTPVAMDISATIGGIPSLSAVLVIIAGITGAMLSPYINKLFRFKSPISKGVSLGTASHAIGTSKAMEYSDFTGTISTIAMILSAIFVSVMTPIILY